MSQVTEGNLDASGLKFAIVVARFNSFITDRLLSGALDALKRSGAPKVSIDIVKVPGSWELPLTAKTLAATNHYAAIIALGAVIRGDTPHFDHVANQASSGLAAVALETGVPVAFGVLTTNTVEQAIDRAGGKSGNKGYDAAITAIEMADLLRRLRK
ncbi:MAG TPA: 6,7-dimethyl-8-ribityllumazine synthase [Bryobacteraceae bacterium]|jgi:6,7-dimethyl-8-ribityllumazine synthase|nr:6,7-dimethyl-8-ribityllumazine synthase [Bryobacteraceae bacterium]